MFNSDAMCIVLCFIIFIQTFAISYYYSEYNRMQSLYDKEFIKRLNLEIEYTNLKKHVEKIIRVFNEVTGRE